MAEFVVILMVVITREFLVVRRSMVVQETFLTARSKMVRWMTAIAITLDQRATSRLTED